MSDEEFMQVILMSNNKQKFHFSQNSKNEIYESGYLNWAEQGAVTEVQDQGRCGSGYAFAVAAALEGTSKLFSPYALQKFSEQSLVSCSKSYGNNGCEGGQGSFSMNFSIKRGISLDENYKYSSFDGEVSFCQKLAGTFYITSYNNVVGKGSCYQIQQYVKQQPVYGSVVAKNWKLYTKGILSDCENDPAKIEHAVTIVGYNTESKNENERYWIIKNSWGTDWGEDGYIRLKYGNTCSICQEIFVPNF